MFRSNETADDRPRDGDLTPVDARMIAAFRRLSIRFPMLRPSYRELAAETGDTLPAVVRSCARLAVGGWITRREDGDKARQWALTAEAACRGHWQAIVDILVRLSNVRESNSEDVVSLATTARLIVNDLRRQCAMDVLATSKHLGMSSLPPNQARFAAADVLRNVRLDKLRLTPKIARSVGTEQ